jgi:dTDP-4-amino-4,6-dideoxygalactose transaminase
MAGLGGEESGMSDELALSGGDKAVRSAPGDLFTWPIITAEDEAAVLAVLRRGGMSGTDVTVQFEEEFADWLGTRHALGFNNGTAAIHAAMFGVGVGVGDEVICPAVTYWASALPAYSLGASIVLADIDPTTLCLDPADLEHRITDRTKAIVVVHYLGHPADMDAIMEIARRRGVAVIEDVSHSQGGYYHGRRLGTIGDVGAMSLMAGKAFAIGEAGMLVTDHRRIYERGIAFGHYERYGKKIVDDELRASAGVPLGGYKYRMHQLSSAVGRVQLKHYDARIAEIDAAMNYFWDQLDGVPGVRAHRPDPSRGDINGGWYSPHGLFVSEELDGLSVTRFTEALAAEGVPTRPGCNRPLHLHPVLNTVDVYGHGAPTAVANADRDVRQRPGSLPVSEALGERVYAVPWFKHDRRELIDEYVAAFVKVSARHKDLLADDPGNPPDLGGWHFFRAT